MGFIMTKGTKKKKSGDNKNYVNKCGTVYGELGE